MDFGLNMIMETYAHRNVLESLETHLCAPYYDNLHTWLAIRYAPCIAYNNENCTQSAPVVLELQHLKTKQALRSNEVRTEID